MSLAEGHTRRRTFLRMGVGALLLTFSAPHVYAEELQNYTPPPMFGGAAPAPQPQQVAPVTAPTPAPAPQPVAPSQTQRAPLMKPIVEGDPMARQKAVTRTTTPQSAKTVPVREPVRPQILSVVEDVIPRPAIKPEPPKQDPIEEVAEEKLGSAPVPEPESVAEAVKTVAEPVEEPVQEEPVTPPQPRLSQDVRVPENDMILPSEMIAPRRAPVAPSPSDVPVKLLPAETVTCSYDAETQAMMLPPDPIVGEDMSSGRRTYGTPKPDVKPLKDQLFLKKYIDANTPPPVQIKGEQTRKAGYADVVAEPLPVTAADIKRAELLSCPLVPMEEEKTRVFFPAGETIVVDGSENIMQSVVKLMQEHGTSKLYIQAHASKMEGQQEIDARRLSLARGLAIRAWIMKQGIFPSRIEIKAMGSMSGEAQADFVDLSVRE